jgi:hypothetical protein
MSVAIAEVFLRCRSLQAPCAGMLTRTVLELAVLCGIPTPPLDVSAEDVGFPRNLLRHVVHVYVSRRTDSSLSRSLGSTDDVPIVAVRATETLTAEPANHLGARLILG